MENRLKCSPRPAKKKKPTRARARPKPHPAGHPCSPLPGSLFLYMKDGKAWIGLSILPHTKHLACARQAEGPIPDSVSCPSGVYHAVHGGQARVVLFILLLTRSITPIRREPDPSSALWLFLVVVFLGFSLPRPAPKTLPDRPQNQCLSRYQK